MDPALPTFVGVAEEQKEQFTRYYAQYLAKLQAAKSARPSIGSAAPAASASVAAPVRAASSSSSAAAAGTSASLSAMLDTAKRVMEPEQRRTIEDTGDTRVMRVPLIPSQQIPMWDGGGGSAFLAVLPSFSPNPAEGNNALFVRGEYYEARGYDRQFGAVNLLADRTGTNGSTVLAQMCYRVDPIRGDGAVKRTYVQGYKLGFWQTTSKAFFNEAQSIISPGREFWWRLVVHPNGFATYVNGTLVNVSVPPPGHELRPGQELYVNLPIVGEAGEKATWRVKQLWWGSLPHDPAAVRQLAQMAGTGAGAVVGNKVRATGVPAGTSEAELRAAWASSPYQPSDVSQSEPGAAVFTFPSEEQVRRILQPGSALRVTVRGAVLTLSQVVTKRA